MTSGTTPSWWRSARGDPEALFAAGWHALTSQDGNDASIAQARKEAASAILRADGLRYDVWMQAGQAGPEDELGELMVDSADRIRLASRELASQLVFVASGRMAASEANAEAIFAMIGDDEAARISLLPGSAPVPDDDDLPDPGPPPSFDAAAHGSELSPRAQRYVDTVRTYFGDTVKMYRWLLEKLESGGSFDNEKNAAEALEHLEYVYRIRPDWSLGVELAHLDRKPLHAWELLGLMRHSIWLITAMGVTSPDDLWSIETIDGMIASRDLGDWADE